MLRRSFLARIGPLIGAFVVGAIIALWSLQQVLVRLDRVNAEGFRRVDLVESIGATFSAIRASLESGDAPADEAAGARLTELISSLIGDTSHAHDAATSSRLQSLAAIGAQTREAMATGRRAEVVAALRVGEPLSEEVSSALRNEVLADQKAIGRQLRTLTLGLTIAALVMVNVAVLVLLRAAQWVLDPVAALVEGSRQLAAERFDHRVAIARDDEFAELARAYNHLAEQLQQSEFRKTEAIRQLAVTLNHSLNNAMSIIEMQLGLLDRQSGGNPAQSKHLREIRATLVRMAEVVSSLHNIRRVVVAEYRPGQMMIDLERSVCEAEPSMPDSQRSAVSA